MFRQPPLAFIAVALGVALCAVPVTGRAQDRSTYERLDRLERDLNMLQRQVYRGAPAPMFSGDPTAAASGEIRMDRLETQMRDLNGRVEEVMNQVEQVRHRIEQLNGDIETRFSQGPAGAGQIASIAPNPPRPAPGAAVRAPRQLAPEPPSAGEEDYPTAPTRRSAGPAGSLTPPGGLPPPPVGGPGGPTAIYGTLTPPGAPPAGTEMANAAPAAAGALPGGSASEQYNHAFGLLKRADYPAAEAALRSFIQEHPKDPMAGNAQYWLGETFYARGKYMEAATAFAEGYKRYPKSPKAPEDLLKLGMSLGRANQKDNACVALGQLDRDFPNPGAAVKERATAEKKRLGC